VCKAWHSSLQCMMHAVDCLLPNCYIQTCCWPKTPGKASAAAAGGAAGGLPRTQAHDVVIGLSLVAHLLLPATTPACIRLEAVFGCCPLCCFYCCCCILYRACFAAALCMRGSSRHAVRPRCWQSSRRLHAMCS
jgi:hypothetical protein